MSEQFNNKDYDEYFSALQKSLDKKKQTDKLQESKQSKPLKRGKIKFKSWVYIVAVILVAVIVFTIVVPKNSKTKEPKDLIIEQSETESENTVDVSKNTLFAEYTADTKEIGEDIVSKNVVVINCDNNQVVASRNADVKCYPASTTKIMTILTAVDYITDYDKTFTFSFEVTDPLYLAEATLVGFTDGEAVSMIDLFYGAILPSGADATVGIAISIAGSEQEFVKLMNEKADQLGLKNTHFTNTSGLFDENHYTTAEDMAVIIREAMKNEICRKVLSTYQYTTTPTTQHPDGILLSSTLFSYMYGTEPEGSDILGGKTGYVNESGYCIASFGKSDEGLEYVCVTLNGTSLWPTIYDQIHLYEQYAK